MTGSLLAECKNLIDGEWRAASNGKNSNVINPTTGENIAMIPHSSKEDVHSAIDAARRAFDDGGWRKSPVSERSAILMRLADLIEHDSDRLARLETINTGKSIKQSSNYDLPYLVDNIRFLAGAARNMDGKAMGEYVDEGTSAIRREPIGVVGVITPWNYPLMMVVWRAVPALLMGNTVVLKPASYTPLTTLEFGKLAQIAGIPKGVLNIITGPGPEIGEEMAKSSQVDMIAFTGSEEVGRKLSGYGSLKKISLELGGKAPFVVFKDARLPAAVEGAVVGGLVNNGQDCANSTRYYIHEDMVDKFESKLIEKLKEVKIGSPLDHGTDMGPLISSAHRKRVEDYIKLGMEEGGLLKHGGFEPKIEGCEGGFFISPTVIRTENEESRIVKEEIFGPVYTILSFTDYDDAIRRCNDVIYGLGASVWTSDMNKALHAVRDLRFGTVWVNEHVVVPSEMPWAGYKQSGHGASLSAYSLEEFTYIKHVYFDLTGKVRKDWYSQIYTGK